MQHFRRWLLVFAVKRNNRYPCFLIFAAVDLGTSIGSATEAMFRRIDFVNINPQREQGVHQMRLADDAGLVAYDAHAFSFDKRQIIIGLHGSRDITSLVDEYQSRFIVSFEDLGMGRGDDSYAKECDGKELSFHFV